MWEQNLRSHLGLRLRADPIFPDANGNAHRPRSVELLREDLKAAGQLTQYKGEELDTRLFRRSFATWLESHCVPGEHIDRLLGHAQQTVRGRHYSAADLAALKAAVETIRLDLGDGEGHESGARQGNESSEKRGDSKRSAENNLDHQTLAPVAQWIEQRFPNRSIGNCKQQQ